ncbi:hypothetical protein J2S50_002350 [Streptomyces sp. DSM 40167]|nr:hypothetical protein [Streptomyces sp. DSM 40167]
MRHQGPSDLLARQLGHVGPARRRVTGRITGIGYDYPAPRGAHRLTGTRVPDLPLAGGGRLYEALRGGRFVLITPASAQGAQAHLDGEGRKERLSVECWASGRRTTVLVRPDGYVAWAADDAGAAETGSAVAAHVG